MDDPVTLESFQWDRPQRADLSLVVLGEPVYMASTNFLPLTIHPTRLHMDRRELEIPEHISLMVTGVQLNSTIKLSDTGSPRSVATPDDYYSDLGHYLFIVPESYLPYLEPLVNWKMRKGHPVTVATTSETGSTANSIKNYIQDAYDTWDSPLRFVVLVGDEDQGIPGHYIQNPEGTSLVTDHPYALLEGEDSFPEVFVGRLSVDTATQLITVVSKIVNYESQPYMGDSDWFKRALMLCTITAAASPQDAKNWVRRKLLENDYTEVDTFYYPFQSANGPYFVNPVNDGVGFINYRGLGHYSGWSGPFIENSTLYSLSNGQKLPIVTSVVCGGGDFASYVDPCFGELWVRLGTSAVPRGAVAFFGPSELYTHTQFNNILDIGIYAGIFDEGIEELGPALWNGKLELWRNYHSNEFFPFGQTPEFYHHVYNLLGDPGMRFWTDTPRSILVEHSNALNLDSDHISVSVTDLEGNPLPNVFVHAFNEENARGLWTDADGSVYLPFIAGLESALAVTVTGKNIQPYLGTVPISSTELPIDLLEWTISDDGLLHAGTTRHMNIVLANPGAVLENVELILETADQDEIGLLDSLLILDSFAGGGSEVMIDTFAVQVDSGAQHGHYVDFLLHVTAGEESWTWERTFPVQAPELRIMGFNLLNGQIAHADSAELQIDLANDGGSLTEEMQLVPLAHELVEFGTDTLLCPAVDADGSTTTLTSSWVHFSDQIFPGEDLVMQFLCIQPQRVDTLSYSWSMGSEGQFSPSRPDAYGYRVFDQWDINFSKAPTFSWNEVDPSLGGHGDVLALYDNYEEMDRAALVPLPFPVTYYGVEYESITVCSNGWIAMGSSPEVSFHNRRIPSPAGPAAMIAPFWDDLTTTPGHIVTYTNGNATRFVVEWSQVSNLSLNTDLSFQVIFYSQETHPTPSGDTEILFQYNAYENLDSWQNYATVGIESPDYSTGLEVTYNNLYTPSVPEINPGTALLFTTERGERLPPAVLEMSATDLYFSQNPWMTSRDSILISNTGVSTLMYNIEHVLEVPREPAANPYAGFDFVKGGAEPDGEILLRETRDEYGYEWLDQGMPGGPEYNWIDIVSPENLLEYEGDPDDYNTGPMDLGFSFPFYDDYYSTVNISSNGTLSFESQESPWANLPLPNVDAPPALIAAWWDDLNHGNTPEGELYFYSNDEDSVVITYLDFPKIVNYYRYTFQVILTSNGHILIQYQDVSGPVTSATVGIQNSQRSSGVQVVYNSANNIDDGTAILIRRPFSWFTADGWTGMLPADESQYFVVTVKSHAMMPGTYEIPLILSSNANNLSSVDMLITMDVIAGELPFGDVNGDYRLHIDDLMNLLDFILLVEEMTEEQFERADVVPDGVINVMDAALLVDLILAAP